MTDAVIVSTARTGLAKSWKGAFNMTHGATLGGHAVQHAVARAGIDPGEIEDCIMGGTFGEAPHPQAAITYARHVAEIPCDLYRRLIRDRDRAPPPESLPELTIARFLTTPPLIDAQTGS